MVNDITYIFVKSCMSATIYEHCSPTQPPEISIDFYVGSRICELQLILGSI